MNNEKHEKQKATSGGDHKSDGSRSGLHQKSISVVIPMYNEEGNAERAVNSIIRVFEKYFQKFEVIIIESGSLDRTGAIADHLADSLPNVRTIHQIDKEGQGSAIRLGFANAKNDFIMYIDGDEPFDIHEVERILPFLDECPVIIGYRIGERENFKRKLYSSVYNRLVRIILGIRVKDVNFSMKVVSRKLLKHMTLRSNGCFYDAELLSEIVRNKVPIKEIGFVYNQRVAGVSTLGSPSVIIKILWEMGKYVLRRKKKVTLSETRMGSLLESSS